MPIVVDPNSPPPPVVADVVSADAVLVARVDTAHAGVLLVIAGAGSDLVQVSRVNPDGSQVLVRSGDPCYAPGGGGVAYDHEAPLGRPVEYRAAPLFADGSTGAASVVSVQVPEPPDCSLVWLKSLDDPDLSVQATVIDWAPLSYAGRVDTATVSGRPYPLASVDVVSSPVTVLKVRTRGRAAFDGLARMVALPGYVPAGTLPSLLLAQPHTVQMRPEHYVVVTSATPTQHGLVQDERWLWDLGFLAVDRPDTYDAPARIPGRSLGALNVPGATLGGLSGGAYLDLLVG